MGKGFEVFRIAHKKGPCFNSRQVQFPLITHSCFFWKCLPFHCPAGAKIKSPKALSFRLEPVSFGSEDCAQPCVRNRKHIPQDSNFKASPAFQRAKPPRFNLISAHRPGGVWNFKLFLMSPCRRIERVKSGGISADNGRFSCFLSLPKVVFFCVWAVDQSSGILPVLAPIILCQRAAYLC